MESRKFLKPVAVTLGCAGAAVAAPVLAPYLGTISIPFFGVVLASIFRLEDFRDNVGKVLITTAAGFLTNLGSAAAEQIPSALSSEHNFHLEKMFATAYLESLKAVGQELAAGNDSDLRRQVGEILPVVKSRLERGLQGRDISILFPVRSQSQIEATTFANRFSAEQFSLIISGDANWEELVSDEIEIALRRWLNEENAYQQRQLMPSNTQIYEPLRSYMRKELPQKIARALSDLVKQENYKESWIAFQRAHLQGILQVLGKVNTTQTDMKQSIDSLVARVEGFASQDRLVEEVADKFQLFLRQLSLAPEALSRILGEQSAELIGLQERLTSRIELEHEKTRAAIEAQADENRLTTRQESDRVIHTIERKVGELQSKPNQPPPSELPSPPLGFTGREDELNELRAMVERGTVTISSLQGMGGVGKTALALVLADEIKCNYPDGQIYLDLKGVSPRSEIGLKQQPLTYIEVMSHVIKTFNPGEKLPESNTRIEGAYRTIVAGKRALLLLDNVRDSSQVNPLIPNNTVCLLLITSRQRFLLGGQRPFDVDKLKPEEAIALVRTISPGVSDQHAAEISKLCDHLPMALRPAASLLQRSLTAERVIERLKDKKNRLQLRDEGRSDGLINLSIEASFDLSYELLAESRLSNLQQRFRSLSVFPDSFDVAAAAAVWGTDEGAASDALAECDAFSLVEFDRDATRFRLHDLARDFADMKLDEHEGERRLAQSRYAHHYVRVLEAANRLYKEGREEAPTGLAVFDREWANTRATWGWATINESEDAIRLRSDVLDAGTSILFLRQLAGERIEWLKVGLEAATRQNLLAAQGRHWCNLGRTYHNYSGQKREEIISCLENALAIAKQVNNLRDEGQALGNLGVVYRDWGKLDLARQYFAKRLKLASQLNDEHSEASTLGNIGKLLLKEKDYEGAAEKFEEQLSMALRLGYIHLQCQALGNKGQALAGLGITDSAIDHLRSSINLARKLGARRAEAGARGELGNVLCDMLGNYSAAKQMFEESLRIAREVQFGRGEFQALKSLGAVSTKLGDKENESAHYESALKYYEEMLLLINRTPDPKNEGLTLWNIAQLNKKLGDLSQACAVGSKSERLLANSGLNVVFKIRKELRRWGCTPKR